MLFNGGVSSIELYSFVSFVGKEIVLINEELSLLAIILTQCLIESYRKYVVANNDFTMKYIIFGFD